MAADQAESFVKRVYDDPGFRKALVDSVPQSDDVARIIAFAAGRGFHFTEAEFVDAIRTQRVVELGDEELGTVAGGGMSYNGSSWNGSSFNGVSWNGSSWNGVGWNAVYWNGLPKNGGD